MRTCVRCRKELEPTNRSFYCSDECKAEALYETNKNPMSSYGDTEYDRDIHYRRGSVRTMGMSPDILAKAEENEGEYGVVEDTDALQKIIFEEMNNPKYQRVSAKHYQRKQREKRLAKKLKNTKNGRRDKALSRLIYYFPNLN